MRRVILISAGLVLATVAAYLPLRDAGFINFDDPTYVTGNPVVLHGLTLRGIGWAFTASHGSNWHPLTWLSHMLDCQMFGDNPGGHHLGNVFIHAANAWLLFLLLRQMTGAEWRSGLVAALFALHPLHVESVAWISERKDVLATFFGLLGILAYVGYARGRPAWGKYLLSLGLFLLSLLCKPMLVTLPFVLLLLDYWPLQRLPYRGFKNGNWRPQLSLAWPLVREKIPYLLMSLGSSAVTVWAQHRGGAVLTMQEATLGSRMANAVASYVTYLKMAFWPVRLSAFYPMRKVLPPVEIGLCFAALTVITILAVALARRRPYFLVGWLWYVGTLVPVIGLVQVGTQAMADRYTYVPLIGIFIAVAWGLADLRERWRVKEAVPAVGAAMVLAACFVATREEIKYWDNSIALFSRALAVTQNNLMAEYNLACALSAEGDQADAVEHFDRALQIKPSYTAAILNRANALNLMGRYDEAIQGCRAALAIQPDFAKAYYLLGNALALESKFGEAKTNLLTALRYEPDYAAVHLTLGNLFLLEGADGEAEVHLRAAVRLEPGNEESRYCLGTALARQKRFTESAACYRDALKIWPEDARALNALAWMLTTSPGASTQEQAEAIALAQRACNVVTNGNPAYLHTLAVAYAETGEFGQAISITESASALASKTGDAALTADLQRALAGYRNGRRYTLATNAPVVTP